MKQLEFFYDLSSPWTYLGFTNLQGVLARTGASVVYRPILVGGVFNAVNQAIYAQRENMDAPRMKHYFQSLQNWAAWTGLKLDFPSPHHPAKSIHAMRMACALEHDQAALATFTKAAFESYFLRAENLDDPEVLVAAANGAGLDGKALRAHSITDAVKTRLRTNTEELIARGGYGSPTMFIDTTDMYFGNDQLPLVERALEVSQ
jgi:2-hydroxychromene-2-carboxylate isomerase